MRVFKAAVVLGGVVLALFSPAVSAAPACSGAELPVRAAPAGESQVIRNASDLSNALQSARGGEVFALEPGNYGMLRVNKTYQSNVTIRSANPASPACFTGFFLGGAANLVLDSLYFDYVFKKDDPHFSFPFSIGESRQIQISNSVFDGDFARGTNSEADGYGFGVGLRIWRSSDIRVSGSVFRKWWSGTLAGQSARIAYIGNTIHTIRSDGINLDAITGLTIEKNHLYDFGGAAGSKDHRDMIQIMRVTPSGSTDIVIRDNVFDMGRGDFTQTIWAGGDGKDLSNHNMRHQNVLIENNMIYNAHVHGISIHGSDNISVRKNSVIRVPGGHSTPAINISADSTSVVIEQNAVANIIGHNNQRDWAVLNNAFIQNENSSKRGFYDREFVYHARGEKNGYNEYGVRAGSTVDQLNAGSSLANNYPTR
ncbi:right-handed parallel beta-helix repeat-containing protein [Ruegeria arenilitoris]|uniref:right-handed parallel beta-helix repeat-containing protein n=1 Tax=Ruegeria arenilitoris TaxID=1173585 RepID=UPI003C7CE7FF